MTDDNPRISTVEQLKKMTPYEIVAAKKAGLIDFEAIGNERRERAETQRAVIRAAFHAKNGESE